LLIIFYSIGGTLNPPFFLRGRVVNTTYAFGKSLSINQLNALLACGGYEQSIYALRQWLSIGPMWWNCLSIQGGIPKSQQDY
jgi:hypothetical protein